MTDLKMSLFLVLYLKKEANGSLCSDWLQTMKRSNSLRNLLHWGTRKFLSIFILKSKAKYTYVVQLECSQCLRKTKIFRLLRNSVHNEILSVFSLLRRITSVVFPYLSLLT